MTKELTTIVRNARKENNKLDSQEVEQACQYIEQNVWDDDKVAVDYLIGCLRIAR